MEGMKLTGGVMTSVVERMLMKYVNKKLDTISTVRVRSLNVVVDDEGIMKISIDASAEIPAANVNQYVKGIIC